MNRRAFIAGLIGKPYRLGADGPDAFDCYGLAAYLQREMYDIDMAGVRPVAIDDESTVAAIATHPERAAWRPVDVPRDGDLVLMANVESRTTHLGVYFNPDHSGVVVHIHERYGVMAEDLPSLGFRGFNNIRFYRRKSRD